MNIRPASLWGELSNIGITPFLDDRQRKRIRITNQVCVTLSLIAFCYVFVFYGVGLKREGLGTLVVVASILTTLVLNRYGQYLFARLWAILAANGAVFAYSYFLGYDSGMPLLLFSFSCLPWVFFELQHSRYIAAGLLVSLAFYYIYISGDPSPVSDIEPAVQQVIHLCLVATQFVILAVCMYFFANQHMRSEQLLIDSNLNLQVQKDELERQQEELAQINEELNQQTEYLRSSEEELRAQEEELRQINTELEERTEAVESARQALVQKSDELELINRYKSEFLANISHELRTPLNSILLLTNLLQQNKTGNLTEKQISYTGIIQKSGADLLNLVNDILDLSKIEAGKIEISTERVSVQDITRDMQHQFSVLATQKDIRFTIETGEGPAFLDTDRQRVSQILKNLLANSFKFTPGGGRVALSANSSGDYYVFSVTDTGIGIAPDKQQVIFEAFRQADGATTRKYGGTGLGLSICRELAHRLGGSLSLQSAPDAGSTFSLILPLSPGTQLPDDGPAASLSAAESGPDDRKQIRPGEKNILIIEADPVFAGTIRKIAHTKGYKTVIATGGEEGLEYAREYQPTAIILSPNLPILHTLRSSEMLRHIPVHVLSARESLTEKHTSGQAIRSSEDLHRGLDEVELFLYSLKTDGFQTRAGQAHVSDHILRNKKVLLIDDDMRNIFSLNALLEDQGMQTVTAENGREALELLAVHPDTHIVLMDIMMPDMDGYDTIRAIRSHKQHSRLPIIALTAKAMAGDRRKCMEAGASDYISKPVDGGKLCSLMRVWLS